MKKQNENLIYHTINKWSKHELSIIDFHRIESGSTELGIPDIYFTTPIKTGWIEQKYITWPKRKNTIIKIKWQPKQLKWLNDHNENVLSKISEAFLFVIDNKNIIRVFRKDYILKEYTQKEFILYGTEINNLKTLLHELGIDHCI